MRWTQLGLTLGALFLAGCSYMLELVHPVGSLPAKSNEIFKMPQEKVETLSYGVVSQQVFTPHCASCHGSSGGVNLQSYEEVTRVLAGIKKTVFHDKTMPKGSSLTQDELSILWNWIEIGSPEFAKDGSQEPLPEVLLPTYDSINKNIFQASCVSCHNVSGTGKRILLDRDSLLDSPLELVLPSNPDESGLVLAVERSDKKRMPPAENGFSELSEEAKMAIRTWIENGAID